ncbi:dihydrodipicolinate synthase family protein [Acidipila sp. EB88]|uniref:dihydrodipicolinate synthase family protein n=1 Tax=Acidipila sp. EB88 TaxID=2305226 RepID=UPI000F5D6714|nr:dihydrodipicolinate synthase family protein [Acidipila sp. EB88]RRA49450.1 dihydrodipicolinate synthase family protein [Acidipila sp. EB88]
MLLEGIFAAATTPFYPDGSLYLRKLEHNMERYSRTPVAGIAVLGSTGESVLLDDAEAREALRTAALAAAPEKVLLAGVAHGSAIGTIRMAEFAASVGYDIALVKTPNYYAPQMTPLAMLTYYRTVADHSPIPVMLYSIPKFTHYDLPVALIAELAHHPNIVGLKDSSGSIERIAAIAAATADAPKRLATVTPVFAPVTGRMLAAAMPPAEAAPALVTIGGAQASAAAAVGQTGAAVLTPAVPPASTLRTRNREVGFQILCGVADKLLGSLVAGASGAVLGLAACAPQACHEAYIAWKEGDLPLAEEKQERIVEASKVVAGRLGISAIKYACDLNGYYGGRARLPLLPLTGEEQAEVARVMQDLRN